MMKGAERQVLLKNGLSFPKALGFSEEDISGGIMTSDGLPYSKPKVWVVVFLKLIKIGEMILDVYLFQPSFTLGKEFFDQDRSS